MKHNQRRRARSVRLAAPKQLNRGVTAITAQRRDHQWGILDVHDLEIWPPGVVIPECAKVQGAKKETTSQQESRVYMYAM